MLDFYIQIRFEFCLLAVALHVRSIVYLWMMCYCYMLNRFIRRRIFIRWQYRKKPAHVECANKIYSIFFNRIMIIASIPMILCLPLQIILSGNTKNNKNVFFKSVAAVICLPERLPTIYIYNLCDHDEGAVPSWWDQQHF